MKIAVIGSGIWGACTAYHLNKAGADVDLYDMWELETLGRDQVVHRE